MQQHSTNEGGVGQVKTDAEDGDSRELSAATGEATNVQLVKHSNATGGMLLLAGDPQRLTPIQYCLLEILSNQALEDVDKAESVRGYVSSYELLCRLPWDARAPEEGHLKQLVRRMRRRIAHSGLLLEARQGLGYRLSFAKGVRGRPSPKVVEEPIGMETLCEGCHEVPAVVRLLCAACARLLAPPLATLPEHVLSASINHPEAWLADGWGTCHPVSSGVRVGRASDCHIRILDCSVSRDHAEFFRVGGAWRCRDLGSRNGTFVNGKVCSGDADLAHGSVVRFGQLAFMLLTKLASHRVFDRQCALTSRLGG